MKKISPSILSADFSKLGSEIKEIETAGADMIHCDIMDGHFVPNISYGPYIVKTVNKITDLPLDVHLMIDNSDKYLDEFHKSGADYISVHYENNTHLHRLLTRIQDLQIKAGVALNPSTPVSVLFDIISVCDFVLIMSVNPGFGGQKFIPESLKKIIELRKIINEYNYKCLIQVDGGVNLDNIKEISDAGADIIVAGASIFNQKDKSGTLKKMKSLINS
jgi:ribulose-phosphate 3-epimerase